MKRHFSSLNASLLSLLITPLAFSSIALAKPHSKKPAKEVYSATDSNEMQPGLAMPVDAQPTPVQTQAPVQTMAAPPARVAKITRAVSFDAVPASQSDAILQRIKIVENLVRKYGRAYDYRAHTLKELQLIQSTLESAAPAPAAAPAPRAAAAPAENSDDVNLKTLPTPSEFEPNNDAQET